jgi:hypothetical protein
MDRKDRFQLSFLRLIAVEAVGRRAVYAAVLLVFWLSVLVFSYLTFGSFRGSH